MRVRVLGGCGIALFCLVAASCSSKSNGNGSGVSSSAAGAGAASGTGAASGGAANGSTGASSNSSAGSGFTPILIDASSDDGSADGATTSGDVCGNTCPAGVTCSPEVCDGIDNNCDGIIDNVDKNNDGVCDCLLIATLGVKGTWGDGDVFQTWLSARSDTGATDLADQTLTPELLAKYEVIVAQDVHQNHMYTDSEVQALQAWVQAGGGFMTLIGYSTLGEPANVNRLLAPFNMDYQNIQILPKMNGSTTVPITQWTPHPIDVGVTEVGVDDGYPVEGSGTVIATGGGYNVGLAQEVAKGHVFMWGDEWITYDSEWTAHPDYQVQLFWVNAIKWLTAATTCQVPIPPTIPK